MQYKLIQFASTADKVPFRPVFLESKTLALKNMAHYCNFRTQADCKLQTRTKASPEAVTAN
jgi:hypothetical protein